MNNHFWIIAPMLFLLVLFNWPAPVHAQETPAADKGILVKGQVTDDKNNPLGGVTISTKGATNSTATNKEGKFSLRIPHENAVLVFSYIGFKSIEQKAGKQRELNIVMTGQPSNLEEVVVIGYGEVKKRDLTGAVGSVDIKEMSKAPVRSFEEALGGRVAGVQVTSPDGQPGATSNIVIRGQGSVTQDNSPLYVIDGFPIENPDNNMINPADIETIDVLKDASATAIYGSRGANGVIVITTKRGRKGPTVITYDGYYGVQNIMRREESMNPYEFVKYQLERDPVKAAEAYLPDGRILEDYRNVQGVNWLDQLYRNGPMHNHNLSVRGGNNETRFSLSGSLTDQDGAIINSGFTRYQGRLTVDHSIGGRIKIGANINYSDFKSYGTPTAVNSNYGLIHNVRSYRPINPSLDIDALMDNGQDVEDDYRFNPILSAQNELRDRGTTALTANGFFQFNILKNFTLKISGGINRSMFRFDVFDNKNTRSANPVGALGQSGVNGGITFTERRTYVNENTLTYNNGFGNHHVNVLAGFTIQGDNSMLYGANAIMIPNQDLGLSGIDEGSPYSIRSTFSKNTLQSLLGRINYDFAGKYLATVSFRADGSSKFSNGNKWGYFPSGSLAWRMSQEKFLSHLKWLTDAKMRLSYGAIGNNRVADYAYFSTLTLPLTASYPLNNEIIRGAIPSLFGNPDLKWETTYETNLGLDLSFFKDRVSLTADLYSKKTKNLLLNANMPPTFGYARAYKNIGSVLNEGLELTLNTTNIAKSQFSWTTTFNIAFNRNRVVSLTDNEQYFYTTVGWATQYGGVAPYITQVGQPISMFYGRIWEGNYQFSDFDQQPDGSWVLKAKVPTNGSAANQIKPGYIKYQDRDGDGDVDDEDRTFIGSPMPKFIGGFGNAITWKGVELSVFFSFSYGNKVLNANRLLLEGHSGSANLNYYATYVNRWTPENQNNTYYATGGTGPYVYSTRVIEDASYIKLRTASVGYNFNVKKLSALKIRNLRVYASGQNLFTLTKYTGNDPEVSTFGTPIIDGFDFSAYPRARTITFGVNLSF